MSSSRYSESEVAAILGQVAQLAQGQLPLAQGMRAAATEAPPRIAAGLRTLAESVERGEPLDQACSDPRVGLPEHVRGLVAAATRTGQLGPALEELLEYHRTVRVHFWNIWSALAYPLTILALHSVIVILLLIWVVPTFTEMFSDFGLKLPLPTVVVISTSATLVAMVDSVGRTGLVIALLVLLVLGFLAVSGRGGALVQQYLVESIPLVGVLWYWSGSAEFAMLLGMMLDKQIPLPEALALTAAGSSRANMRRRGAWMAQEIRTGQSLSGLVETSGCLPASILPLLRWGESQQTLPEALRTSSGLLMERLELRAELLRSIASPMLYLCIGFTISTILVALLTPMVSLITSLT